MGFFSKLLGKKDDDLGLDLGKDMKGADPLGLDNQFPGSQPFGQPQPSSFQPQFGQQPSFSPQEFGSDQGFSPQAPSFRPAPPQGQDYVVSKEMELISSKLDSLRSSIETVNARLANLERMVENDQRRRW